MTPMIRLLGLPLLGLILASCEPVDVKNCDLADSQDNAGNIGGSCEDSGEDTEPADTGSSSLEGTESADTGSSSLEDTEPADTGSSSLEDTSPVDTIDTGSVDSGDSDSGGSDLPNATTITVHPIEVDDILYNPGTGFADFHFAWGGHLTEEQYPRSSVAYFRWTWRQVEPEDGVINWDLIDNTIAQARAKGEQLSFRVIASDEGLDIPDWLDALGVEGQWVSGAFVPDWADATFMQYMERLIRALGERYDDHPGVDHVDIGSVGRWGEWNMADVPGGELPSMEVKQRYVDWYLESFPNTPLVMLVADRDALEYAVDRGAGWRGDCLGDYDFFSPTWNHMDWYPQQIAAAGAGDAWREGPVQFEVCWTMQHWFDYGYDAGEILDYALDMHVSVINAKSSAIPPAYRDDVDEFLKKAGYRIVLDELSHPDTALAGGSLALDGVWRNTGVAPPYHGYRIAYRLRDGDGRVAASSAGNSVKGWLPGEHRTADVLALPDNLVPGSYRLDVTVWAETQDEPFVKLAIDGRASDGWYPLSEITVVD